MLTKWLQGETFVNILVLVQNVKVKVAFANILDSVQKTSGFTVRVAFANSLDLVKKVASR